MSKGKKNLRTIVIGNEKYRWGYFYDHLDFKNYPFSYLLICSDHNRKHEIRLVFHKLRPPMLWSGDKGEPAVKNGGEFFINLNEPKYIKEIIEYLMDGIVSFQLQDKWVFDDGEAMLRKMGYILAELAAGGDDE